MLTQEQQQVIEDSLWVVNTVLKAQNLQGDEDLKQDAILYMCKCLQRYDKKHSNHAKWTTFAYKSLYLYIKTRNAKQVKKDAHFIYDPELTIRKDEKVKDVKEFLLQYRIKHILYHCNDREKQVVMLKLQGYTAKQIADKMNLSQSAVQDIFIYLKKKIRKLRNEENR